MLGVSVPISPTKITSISNGHIIFIGSIIYKKRTTPRIMSRITKGVFYSPPDLATSNSGSIGVHNITCNRCTCLRYVKLSTKFLFQLFNFSANFGCRNTLVVINVLVCLHVCVLCLCLSVRMCLFKSQYFF